MRFRAWGRDWSYLGTPSEKFEMFYDVSVVTTFHHKEQHVIADFGMYNESEYNGTEIIDYTLMQSTGLFDINDKEIFEGDIVRISMRIGKRTTTSIGAVAFDKIEVCFKIRNELGSHYVTMFHTRYFEVIGDVYQNPELVEE